MRIGSIPTVEAVRALVGDLAAAWMHSDDHSATSAVNELADELHHLSAEPRFQAAFRACFASTFEVTDNLPGMEELCRQLAPACTWCTLAAIAHMMAE